MARKAAQRLLYHRMWRGQQAKIRGSKLANALRQSAFEENLQLGKLLNSTPSVIFTLCLPQKPPSHKARLLV
eukprot:6022293-Pleurochrysis_carterae.AAC.2